MRIAFISGMAGYPWGGSEMLWSESAKVLKEGGHEVFAVVSKWPNTPRPIESLRNSGIKVEECKWVGASWQEKILSKLTRKTLKNPGFESSWKSLINFNPDVVCISHGGIFCGFEWMKRCCEEAIPFVSLAQANFEQWWPKDEVAEEYIQIFKKALKVFFVSYANLKLFERQLGTLFPCGEVVWNPFNVSWDTALEWPPEENGLCLACPGRLDPTAKGQDIIMSVLRSSKWTERPIHINFYGQGPMEKGLRRLAALEGVENQVSFCGHVSDVEIIWKKNHGLILASRYEGLPLVIIEAMLCGRPSIVTNVAGNTERLLDNTTGFIAEAPTVTHLDEAMERAWARRQDWKFIGSAAAVAIREQAPKDPALAFARKLVGLV